MKSKRSLSASMTSEHIACGPLVPARAHAKVGGNPNYAWENVDFFLNPDFELREFTRGNCETREGFHKWKSLVTLILYCFNIFTLSRGNVRQNIKKNYTEGIFHHSKIVLFHVYKKIRYGEFVSK